MHKRLALAAALGLGGLTTFAAAEQPVVVELFTSQGCSSCPPADELLGELSHRDDVIALALHVDYWDYIGWADTFAQPAFTERQHNYGRANGSTVVYTPQMIIGGSDYVVGYRPVEVADLIAAHVELPDPVVVETSLTDAGWVVRADWQGQGSAPDMVVQIVTYSPVEEVEITRGENAGLSTSYYNVVTSWQVVAEWSGADPFEAQVTPASDAPHIVIVQSQGHGSIMGAARLD